MVQFLIIRGYFGYHGYLSLKYIDFLFEPEREKTNNFGSDQVQHTNLAVQSQKMARGWRFCI